MLRIETTYSAHDGGWYCEVWDKDGRTLYTTDVYPTKEKAERGAQNWTEEYERQHPTTN